MSLRNTLFVILLVLPWVAQAQVEVTPTFRFQDGIYLTFEAFQRNQPSFTWDDYEKRSVTNPQTLVTQVDFIKNKNTQEYVDLNKIWGICLEGLPFVRIPKDSINKELATFAGLRVSGNISYYSYENRVEKEYDFAAYNPFNGQPFRKATVSRMVNVFKEKVFSFETGEISNFERQNLGKLMQNDPQLRKVLNDLDTKGENYKEQLFQLLMSYNRRHPVFFKE
ncbi:MAG: hypothetical protein Sapg2KO_00540 [Saprospiraceae bacterium]